jgi:hypothetical protein
MLTVGNNTAGVEELLGNGLLSCPGCGGRLGGWGHASRRPVFMSGRVGPLRVFRTAELMLFHAVSCRFRYSSWTSCGVL